MLLLLMGAADRFFLEVICTFDHSLEKVFLTKVTKYQPLVDISQLQYVCRLLVLFNKSLCC